MEWCRRFIDAEPNRSGEPKLGLSRSGGFVCTEKSGAEWQSKVDDGGEGRRRHDGGEDRLENEEEGTVWGIRWFWRDDGPKSFKRSVHTSRRRWIWRGPETRRSSRHHDRSLGRTERMKNHGGQEWDEAEGEHRRQRLMLNSSILRLLRKS